MGTSASFALARKIVACLSAALLSSTLMPASALAGEDIAGSSVEEAQEANSNQADEAVGASAEADGSTSADSSVEVGTLAASLMGRPVSFVNADVALDGEPVIGSFTVDGLTFAVTEGSNVELVGVSRPEVGGSARAASEAEAEGSASEVAASIVALPEFVAYNDVEYAVTSIGAYAFYLSGVTSVELPASVIDVDDRAFRSSDIASVEVDEGNPSYSSFDGALYSADYSSLLLIPEGKQGAVLLPKETEVAEASKFSHCSLVDAISAEDGAAFASENGLLYDASLTTLLRVPAGATEITIREGCTTIAAGAMEGCAKLTAINAPASVTSISPDVFTSVPTVSLPAAALAEDAPQLSAMVALSSVKDGLVEVNPSSIVVGGLQKGDSSIWESVGLTVSTEPSVSKLDQAEAYAAHSVYTYTFCATAEATYFVGGLGSQYSYCFNGSGAGGTHVALSWDKGTALVPDSDAVVTVSVAGYKRSATIYPTGDYANYWKRPDCGSLIGFLSSTGENYFSASQVANDSSFQFTIYGRNVNNTGQNGSGYHMPDAFKPVFEKALHTFNLNYKDCPSPLTAYSRVRGPFVLPDEPARDGYTFKGWFDTKATTGGSQIGVAGGIETAPYFDTTFYARWEPNTYKIAFDARGGDEVASIQATYDADVTLPAPTRQGYVFKGWDTEADGTGSRYQAGVALVRPNLATSGTVKLYAQWERVDYDLGFDVDSEPGDEDYPGIEKPDETINVDDGPTAIEDPKRPGYVFQGWVIPNAEGTEAIDQKLVYQDETDGKWYVDASKLPDYADDQGRVELTARWTSVISVDVPPAATFYYDLVTDQSGEAHEAALSGTTSFSSRSQVDLRVCGLESVKAAGADALFSSGADGALLSVYPAKDGSATTVEDAQGPAGEKPSIAVDFALDDIVLEAAFSKAGADAFSIPAGDDLTLSYRLNLGDGASLDYDKVLSMAEGDEASLASISYCFAADADVCCFWTVDDGKTLSVFDIKADAEAIAAGDAATTAKYTAWMNADHRFYVKWYDQGLGELNGGLAQGKYSTYEVRIIGLNHDDKSDGTGKAGITFQFVECLDTKYQFDSRTTNSYGWAGSAIRGKMNNESGEIWMQAPEGLRSCLETVSKVTHNASGASTADLLSGTSDKLFLLSWRELVNSLASGEADGYPAYGWKWKEGSQYAFWAKVGVPGTSRSEAPKKSVAGTVSAWSLRTCHPQYDFTFMYVGADGYPFSGYNDITQLRGISPTFCL